MLTANTKPHFHPTNECAEFANMLWPPSGDEIALMLLDDEACSSSGVGGVAADAPAKHLWHVIPCYAFPRDAMHRKFCISRSAEVRAKSQVVGERDSRKPMKGWKLRRVVLSSALTRCGRKSDLMSGTFYSICLWTKSGGVCAVQNPSKLPPVFTLL